MDLSNALFGAVGRFVSNNDEPKPDYLAARICIKEEILMARSAKTRFFFNLERVKSRTDFCYMIALQGK